MAFSHSCSLRFCNMDDWSVNVLFKCSSLYQTRFLAWHCSYLDHYFWERKIPRCYFSAHSCISSIFGPLISVEPESKCITDVGAPDPYHTSGGPYHYTQPNRFQLHGVANSRKHTEGKTAHHNLPQGSFDKVGGFTFAYRSRKLDQHIIQVHEYVSSQSTDVDQRFVTTLSSVSLICSKR